MSENQPPQGPWQQGPYHQGPQGPQWQHGPQGQGQQQGWQPASPVSPRPPGKRRLGVILGSVGAAAALVLAAGGVFAWQQLSGGGPQPAEALPDSSLAYARVDLDPSASQKVDILRLLRRVPEFSEATGIDSNKTDLRKTLVEKATESSGCDVDYEEDIEPWIGDRAAVAAVPHDGKPAPVFAVQNSDEEAAKEGIEKLADCGSGSAGVAAVGDYVVVAQEQSLADDVAADAEESPLSEDKTFQQDMDTLGEQGVASFWADSDGFAELAGAAAGSPGTDALTTGGVESVAGALRAGSDYLELATVAHRNSPIESDKRSEVSDLPESTVFAASIAGGSKYVDPGWSAFTDAMGSMSYDFQYKLDSFEQQTGISLPDDLKTILGDNVMIAVDSRGLDALAEAGGQPDPSTVGMGIEMTTDSGAAADLISRINQSLSAQRIPELTSKQSDDGMVVATNDDYASDLSGHGSLGDSEAFKTVVPEADDAVGVAYLDVDQATDIAEKVAEQQAGATGTTANTGFIDSLDPIEAIGMSINNGADGRNTAVTRVSFD